MKRSEVKVGHRYRLIVSGRDTVVTVREELRSGAAHLGWTCADDLGQSVRVKDPNRLRRLNNEQPGAADPVPSVGAAVPGPAGRADREKGAAGYGKRGKPPTPIKADSAKSVAESKPRRLSGLDAAARVLAERKAPMNCKDLWAAIDAAKLWKTTGKTPHATLYSAMLREIAAKDKESRFMKTERGMFTLAASA